MTQMKKMAKLRITALLMVVLLVLTSADVEQATSAETDYLETPSPIIFPQVECCADNKIGGCIPNTHTEERCNEMCTGTCGSGGGHCKNNKCHCNC